MAPMSGTGISTNWLVDNPTRSPLGLAVAKAVEEAETKVGVALVAAEVVNEAVVASKAVYVATAMTTAAAVAKIITTATKAHTVEAPRTDRTIKAMGALAITMRIHPQCSLGNKAT